MARSAWRSVILRLEVERGAVDAVAQAALVARTVLENVAQVPFAARADHFGADHAVRQVAMLLDRAVLGAGEARPARPAVELGVAFEQRLAATGADVLAGSLVSLVLAGEGPLGAAPAQDVRLRRRQLRAPLGIGQVHLLGHAGRPRREIGGSSDERGGGPCEAWWRGTRGYSRRRGPENRPVPLHQPAACPLPRAG